MIVACRRVKSVKKGERGASLVETLVAISLIAMMVIFVISVFPNTRKGMQLSEDHVNAAFLAQAQLDQARSLGFSSVASVAAQTVTLTGRDNGNASSHDMTYQTTVVDSTGDPTLSANEKEVYVTVTWHEATGTGTSATAGDKSITVETVLTKVN